MEGRTRASIISVLILEPSGIDSWARYKIGKVDKKDEEEGKEEMNDYDRKRSPRDRRNTLASPRSRVNGLIGKLKNRKSIAVVHGNANKVPFYDMEKIVKNPAYGLSEFSEELIEGGKWVTSNKYHVNPEKIVDFFEKGSEGEKDFKKLKKANVT